MWPNLPDEQGLVQAVNSVLVNGSLRAGHLRCNDGDAHVSQ
jgi:hypothetical protein